jgi:hypothetical protein
VLHQKNVNVVDDDLSDEENNSLNCLSKGGGLARDRMHLQFPWHGRQEVSHHHCGRNRSHSAQRTISRDNKSYSNNQPGKGLHHKIAPQTGEKAKALHAAAFHAQGGVNSYTNGKKAQNPVVRQVQIRSKRLLRKKEDAGNSKACNPGLSQQGFYDR